MNADAVAVLVANNVAGDGIGMAQDGTPNQPTVPAYNVSLGDSAALKPKDGRATTIGAALAYFVSGNNDFMAAFSSQGPTDVDFRVKPDVVAPGVNVLSSIPTSFCGGNPCFTFLQGTSMATPHLAGSAAVVRQQPPDWSAAQVRSAIVNTADQGVLKPSAPGASATDVNIIGAGRENLLSAVNASVAVDPVSVSFGAVPSGSGQARSAVVTLTNLSSNPQTYGLSVVAASGSGVSWAVPPSVSAPAGGTVSFTVSMSAAQGAPAGSKRAKLNISVGTADVANAVLYTFVK